MRAVATQIERAEKEEHEDVQLALLRAELLAAQEAVKAAVSEHMDNAALVATTTTLAYIPTSPVSPRTWNTVLVDEVTMVTPAMCTFLASRASDRLLLAGDPRQLGPVYQSGPGESADDYEWMGRDVFDKSGVSYGVEERRQIRTDDSRLARITSQRRCAPAIWRQVERLYPEVANIANATLLHALIQLEPSPGQPIVILDTSGVHAQCERSRGSWQNPLSAELALEVAAMVAAEAPQPITMAIISPYRAQVRLLRQWLRGEKKAETTPYERVEVEAGTVHQFQGSDADVVIFDVSMARAVTTWVGCFGMMPGSGSVNVAITRAKGKLIVIADTDWCRRVRIHNYNTLLGELVLGYRASKTLRVHQRPLPTPDAWPGATRRSPPLKPRSSMRWRPTPSCPLCVRSL